MRPLFSNRPSKSYVRRRRRSFGLEPLENRFVLAAPVGVNDTYNLAEDQSVSSLPTAFEATFNNTNPPVIATGATWNYLDRIQNELGDNQSYPQDGSNVDWNSLAFDVGTSRIGPWGVGATPLQAGGITAFPGAAEVLDGIDDATESQNLVTTYLFRRAITLSADQAGQTTGSLRLLCDDGCVIYINGVEVQRLNMAAGGTPGTNAFSDGGNAGNEDAYTTLPFTIPGIPGEVLREGANVVAVELHQNNLTSSDVGFDLEMTLGAAGGSTEGFVYADDTFGTNNPNRASGSFEPTGGDTGGGLSVSLEHVGGGGGVGNAKSGGWVRAFNLPAAATIDVSLRYRLTASQEIENNEYGEAVLTIDGTRYGSGAGTSLARFVGDGNGGQVHDTGWQQANFSIPLAAGDHILRIGGYNNGTSQGDEWVEVFFDDVVVGGGTGAAGVLLNDTDTDGDTLTAQKLTDPANGALLFNANGTFVYSPNANFFGVDSFTYRPFDGTSSGNTTTVTFNVAPVNDGPTALSENYATATGQTLVVAAQQGVLANDADIDNLSLTAVLVGNVANGTLVFDPDGSFTYTSNAGFIGTDSFTYRASDGQLQSGIVTVAINVTAENTAPTANDDAYQVEENATLSITKSGAVPPQQVFFSNFNSGIPSQITGVGQSAGVQGYADEGTGTNTFTGNFLRNTADNQGSGAANPITLTLTNLPAHNAVDINFLLAIIDSWNGNTGQSSPDFLNISIDGTTIFTESFDTADSQDQSYSSPSGVRLVDGEQLGFATGGFAVDAAYNMYLEPRFKNIPHTGSTLTISWFASGQGYGGGTDESFAIDNLEVILNLDETNDVALVPSGSVWRYLDDGSDQGAAWRAPGYNDLSWESGPAELGYGDFADERPEATVVRFGGDTQNKHITTYFRRTFEATNVAAITSLAVELLRDDGAAVFLNGVEIVRDNLPENAAFDTEAFGAIPQFEESQFLPFEVDHSLLVEGTNVIAVEVHQADPSSSDLSFDLRLTATQASDLGVLANDVDLEGAALSVQLVDNVDHGTLTLNNNGTFTYTPSSNYHGTDTFTYRNNDGFLASNDATVTITILPGPNEPAVAANDTYSATEDTALHVPAATGVLANDSDPEDDSLIAELVGQATAGVVILAPNGSFTYTPNANAFGPDSFTYRVYDGTDYSSTATVALNVAGANDVPVAVNDLYFAEFGGQLTVSAVAGVTANDEDPDRQGLTATRITNPTHGSLTFNGDGSFVYTPNPTYRGMDSFTYRVSDGGDDSNTATVSIRVDSTPVANNDGYSVAEEGTLNVSVGQGVLINDTDGDLDPLTASLVAGPANGVLSLVSNGSFTYTPNINFHGQDTFTYRANDGDQFSNAATVTITVTPVNDAPVAFDDAFSLFANDTSTVNAANGVLANDTDVDSAVLTAVLLGDVANGTLTLASDGSFVYTPDPDFVGTDSFIYGAHDGIVQSQAVMVTLTVNPASELIVINELMYHPSSENDAEEWIEIYNTGAANVNLAGWQFTNGVSYTFPAGPQSVLAGKQYLVVAADVATFLATHPGFTGTVIGGWTGSLSNSGEQIELSDANGLIVEEFEYSEQGDWATRVAGPLDNGHRGWDWEALHDGGGRTLELINTELPNTIGGNWSASTAVVGTPGAANSVAATNVAPLVTEVLHSPAVPRSTDPVTITAVLFDELDVGVTASVYYRVSTASPGPFTELPMFDDGMHSDGNAGDGVYGAVIQPPAGAVDAVVEFFVRSRDLAGNARTYPMANDTGAQAAPRLLYQYDDEVYTGDQPIYRIVMTAAEANEFENINRNSNALMNATFVAVRGADSSVTYEVGVRIRGASSRDRDPPGLRVNVPHDRPWNGKTSFNLNSQYTWLQTLGGALFHLSGLAGFTATPVQVRMNSVNRATGNPQAGSYVHVETIDNEWASDHLPDDDQGNVYTKRRPDNLLAYRGAHAAPYYNPATDPQDYFNDGWEKKTNESENDWSDLNEMLRAINQVDPAPGVSYFDRVNAIVDIDQWTRYFALMVLMNSRETSISNGADDDYDIYRGVVDPRFQLVPHDLDTIFNQGDTGTSPTATIFQATDGTFSGSIPVLIPFFDDPQVLALYYGHLRNLLETVFSKTQLDATIDNLLGGWINENTINNLKSFADQRRAHVLSLLPTSLTVTSNLPTVNGYAQTTNPSTVALTGIADAVKTRKVFVAGNQVNWDAHNRAWSTAGATAATDTLIPFASTWRYLDDGSNQGTAWREPIFSDAGWDSGPAQLGYGDGDEATIVDCGPAQGNECDEDNNGQSNKYITTYFRHTFEVETPSQYSSLVLRFRRDDGIAVYLNGTEITRNNLAANAAFDQGASNATDDGNSVLEVVNIPVSLLAQGNNVIAAEVHQQNTTSTDMTFDLSLLANIPAPGATIALNPGINRVLVQALGENDVEVERRTIDIWYDDGTTANVSGTLATNTTWTPANGPYRVTGNITVPAGVTLTIQPGTSVFFDPGTSLTINGRLAANGTVHSHIFMGAAPGAAGKWNGINFANTTQLNQMTYVDMAASDGSGQSITATESSITLDRMTWTGVNSTVLELSNSSFRVTNSIFPSLSGTADDEVIHGNGIAAGGTAILDGNTFGTVSGYNDVIDFTGGQRTGPILQVLNNVFLGGSDDGLDLNGADAHIEGNTFRNFHKNNTSDSTSNAIATGIDGGVASEITVARNFFYDNDHAILVKEGSFLTLQNNTIVGSTIAAINFDEPNRPVQPGLGARLDGNILTGNAADFANVYNNHPTEVTTQLTINYSLVNAAYLSRGIGNLNSATDEARISDPANNDFSLAPGSAAKGTGPVGLDMGGAVPRWAAVGDEPTGVTPINSATLTVYGPGVTGYNYRVDNGTWSGRIDIATPINLSGLAAGSHIVHVTAQNSASANQGFGNPTPSATWTVDPTATTIRINEVLASNVAALDHEGTFPDAIELYNFGSTAVDVSGWTLSDDPTDAGKYEIPDGTSIGAGEYLLIYADDLATSGLHTGFGLSQNGESLGLYRSELQGGTVVDSISFGAQISDFSLGRDSNGVWTLNKPTLGAANVVQPLGDSRKLRINEWLADSNRLFRDDRIELHNLDSLPVNMAGLRLTDNPVGKPDKHTIAPLSFIAGAGYAIFIPDEETELGPEHLNFSLDANYEMIALLDSNLTLLDQVLFMSQRPDVSEGRLPDGQLPQTSISPPNIGLPNSTVLSVNDLLDSLRITELQYNPPGGSDNEEFIELKNIGTVALNLDGVYFRNGVDFEFPAMMLEPGAFVVVVADLTAFQAKYGTNINVAGVYSGRLDNTGENIELFVGGAFEAEILDFTYDDAWYPSTDGGGPSMVIKDPTNPDLESWRFASSWRASGSLSGSPGSDDALDGTAPTVREIIVSSSTWTGPFVTQLDILGLGQGGYRVPTGAGQLTPIPWSNLDTITVVFSEPVNASAGSLTVNGVSALNYATAEFSMDGTRATWRLMNPIVADKINLTLPGTITDGAGNPLGSQFSFRMDVLAGDVNGSGSVNTADIASAAADGFAGASNAAYKPRTDVNGDGRVNIADSIAVRNRIGASLPAGNPGGSPGESPAAPAAIVAARSDARSKAADAAIDVVSAGRMRTRMLARTAGSDERQLASARGASSSDPSRSATSSLRARRARAAASPLTHDAALAGF
jgi:VCBS repeat-containing protein